MSEADLILGIVVVTALAFDFTNGFHDTANVVATSISTKAMPPRFAVGFAAVLNFAGAFISLEVAATVAKDVVDPLAITTTVIFAGLIGAITWNLITWYFGLPSSSSHALIGGVVGATLFSAGASARARRGNPRQGADPRGDRAGSGLRRRRDRDRDRLLDRRPPTPWTGHPRLSLRPDPLRRPARARPRDQRRAEDDGGDHARAGRQRQPLERGVRGPDVGRRSRRRPRSRWVPTWGVGGSSRRWARGSSRWTRPRASPPRAPGRP